MPSWKQLKASLAHLSRLYLSICLPHSLASRRAEPFMFAMVLQMDSIPDGTKVGPFVWSDQDWDVFIFRRLNRTLWPTGVRVASVVKHTSSETMYFTFGSLTWHIYGWCHGRRAP